MVGFLNAVRRTWFSSLSSFEKKGKQKWRDEENSRQGRRMVLVCGDMFDSAEEWIPAAHSRNRILGPED